MLMFQAIYKEQQEESMSNRLKLNAEVDSLKNSIYELRNENDELNSTMVNTNFQINTLELAFSKEVSKVTDLSNAITQQKNDYEKELLELNQTLVCIKQLFLNVTILH